MAVSASRTHRTRPCWSFRSLTGIHAWMFLYKTTAASSQASGRSVSAPPLSYPPPPRLLHVPPSRAPAEQDQRSNAQYEGDGDTDRPRGDRAVPIERFMDSQKNEGEPNVGIGGAREGGRIVYRLPRNGAVDSLNEPGWVYRPLEPQNAIACTFV